MKKMFSQFESYVMGILNRYKEGKDKYAMEFAIFSSTELIASSAEWDSEHTLIMIGEAIKQKGVEIPSKIFKEGYTGHYIVKQNIKDLKAIDFKECGNCPIACKKKLDAETKAGSGFRGV